MSRLSGTTTSTHPGGHGVLRIAISTIGHTSSHFQCIEKYRAGLLLEYIVRDTPCLSTALYLEFAVPSCRPRAKTWPKIDGTVFLMRELKTWLPCLSTSRSARRPTLGQLDMTRMPRSAPRTTRVRRLYLHQNHDGKRMTRLQHSTTLPTTQLASNLSRDGTGKGLRASTSSHTGSAILTCG